MEHEANWLLFERTVRDRPYSFMVDMSFAQTERVPDVLRPLAMSIVYQFQDTEPMGMGNGDELAGVEQGVDALIERAKQECECVNVGRYRGNGAVEWFYYLPEKHRERFETLAGQILSGQTHRVRAKADASWKTYLAMLPSQDEHAAAMDRLILHSLMQQGDGLKAKREVEHVLIVPAARAAACVKELKALGYKPEQDAGEGGEEVTIIGRIKSSVLPEDIARMREAMVRLATAHEGMYDGWGTGVVKK